MRDAVTSNAAARGAITARTKRHVHAMAVAARRNERAASRRLACASLTSRGMVIRANGKLPAADKNLGLAAARWRGNAASLCDMTRAALLVFSAAVVGVNCFGYLPDPEVLELYPDVGGCASSLEERMFDGEYSQSESSAEQCWTMCTESGLKG